MIVRRMWRRIAVGAMVPGATAVMAPAAGAAIGPVSVTLSPGSAPAASTGNLGTDITFSPSGGDSAKDLTLHLPPGLLANPAVDGGACLKSATPVPACQVGSGTVTAALGGLLPAGLPATFDLVAPPSPADIAGLAVLVTPPLGQPTQLGSPAAVTIRPVTDPRAWASTSPSRTSPTPSPASLALTVIVKDARGTQTKVPLKIRNLHLSR